MMSMPKSIRQTAMFTIRGVHDLTLELFQVAHRHYARSGENQGRGKTIGKIKPSLLNQSNPLVNIAAINQGAVTGDSHDDIRYALPCNAINSAENIMEIATIDADTIILTECYKWIIGVLNRRRHNHFIATSAQLQPLYDMQQHRLTGQWHKNFTWQPVRAHSGLDDCDTLHRDLT
ncbi:hypothetical protein BOW51_07145 [Solemya velesiana gill symbiont]|uniref:Uncharacterized protein n=1 Tax=Solemya velesiana gill symbiont TaxID=1918948 RepID=A0A1T2KUA8_9GAMM|nr:hypothetical protein BOW51_07145 [Solemya velesiana gill symbiont]